MSLVWKTIVLNELTKKNSSKWASPPPPPGIFGFCKDFLHITLPWHYTLKGRETNNLNKMCERMYQTKQRHNLKLFQVQVNDIA